MKYILAEITSDDLVSFVAEGSYEYLLEEIIYHEIVDYKIYGIDLSPEEIDADVEALRADLAERFDALLV